MIWARGNQLPRPGEISLGRNSGRDTKLRRVENSANSPDPCPGADRRSFRQADVKRAVAGAIAGGLEPGKFAIEITKTGRIRLLPSTVVPTDDDDPIEVELRELRRQDGHG